MAEHDPLHEVLREIGLLTGIVQGIKDNQETESKRASASRNLLYSKIEDAAGLAAKAAQSAEAAKASADLAHAKIDNDVMPTVLEYRRWKFAGRTWRGFASFAGVSIIGFFWWAWDVISAKLGV